MDRTDPKDANDPTLPPNERTPGWEPVVGTTYEPQDEYPPVTERGAEHHEHHEHVEGEDVAGRETDATGDDRR